MIRLTDRDPVPTTAAYPGPVEPGDHPDDTGRSVTPTGQNRRPRRSRTRRQAHVTDP